MDTTATYHGGDGNTSPLRTADDVATALSDLSSRVLALETKPAVTADGPNVGIEDRTTRLERVLESYFGSEFIAYDRARATVGTLDAGTNGQQVTTGNGQGADGGNNPTGTAS